MSALRCPRHACGAVLRATTDGNGRAALVCDACDRNRRGRCRDCPAPLATRNAMRCPACSAARARELVRQRSAEYYADPEYRAKKLAQQKAYAQRPGVREKRLVRARQYNAQNRGDPLHRLYMREWMRRWYHTPEGHRKAKAAKRRQYQRNREKRNAYTRAYYAAHREELCAKQRERYRRHQEARRAAREAERQERAA